MIIDCISDLHGYYPELEGGDLLIVAGDLTARDTQEQHLKFSKWFAQQNYKHRILIAGNHDNTLTPWCPMNLAGMDYLCDSGTEFEDLKIWGSPWTKRFPGINPQCCAFTVSMNESLKDKWDLIPDDVDILITHMPPFGIYDRVNHDFDAHVGDLELRETLDNRIKPKLHVFGHIHENGGGRIVLKRPGFGNENNTLCINASYVNEQYRPINKPVRVIL